MGIALIVSKCFTSWSAQPKRNCRHTVISVCRSWPRARGRSRRAEKQAGYCLPQTFGRETCWSLLHNLSTHCCCDPCFTAVCPLHLIPLLTHGVLPRIRLSPASTYCYSRLPWNQILLINNSFGSHTLWHAFCLPLLVRTSVDFWLFLQGKIQFLGVVTIKHYTNFRLISYHPWPQSSSLRQLIVRKTPLICRYPIFSPLFASSSQNTGFSSLLKPFGRRHKQGGHEAEHLTGGVVTKLGGTSEVSMLFMPSHNPEFENWVF